MRLDECFANVVRRLASSSESPRADALRLFAHVGGIDAAQIVAFGEREFDNALVAVIDAFVGRRIAGEPVAYLTGHAGFYGREFAVDGAVLVPRPETEALIIHALDFLEERRSVDGGLPLRICDVGTGSGAIAVTLAAECASVEVTAIDISPSALRTARKNARSHGVEERLQFIESNLLAAIDAQVRFDLLIANLPYIPSADVPQKPDPVGFEPLLALDGGADGLDLYRRLFAEMPGRIAPGGLVLCEAAPPTIAALAAIARDLLDGHCSVHADAGGTARYLAVRRI